MSTDNALAWWTSLSPEAQRVIVLVASFFAVMRVLGLTNALVLAAGVWYLSTAVPSKASFLPWFEQWFKREYFPKLAEKLSHELTQRAARRRSLFDKLNAMLVGATKGLQASFVYELLDKRVIFSDLYFCRFASINIGSRAKPSSVAFIGILDKWFLAPWHRLDFDSTSLLEEIDPTPASETERD
ncbi:hypothetical protein T492DRAFT_943408 [Pavlovales sp. CCMP2436]|nr:hypothetical protein T492DRAFT_943408 [Pavlovales sp. CCMP2436]|mmetsp:Transcript_28908/g.67738  ORF Transcript_28908/g.67738 Transcript_28908/m.67738 type:complete len:185 (+) Transcript_28908:111-665(+)